LSYRPNAAPRKWRSRIDPFAQVWPELCKHLEQQPDITGKELFAELQKRHPEHQYGPGQLRTLQRRLEHWRAKAARRLVFGIIDTTGPYRGFSVSEGRVAPPHASQYV
jgi:hypothetical protein